MRKSKAKMLTCPRCGLKMLPGSAQCDDCGLIFERLSYATNKDAKRKIKRGDRDFIIKTNVLPSDVKYWKLLLLVIFTGFAGGHNYYVGRYLRGIIFSIFCILTLLCTFFNSLIMQYYPAWMELVGGLLIGPFALVWLWDISMVLLKRFKVPIAIDLKGQDLDEVLNDKG